MALCRGGVVRTGGLVNVVTPTADATVCGSGESVAGSLTSADAATRSPISTTHCRPHHLRRHPRPPVRRRQPRLHLRHPRRRPTMYRRRPMSMRASTRDAASASAAASHAQSESPWPTDRCTWSPARAAGSAASAARWSQLLLDDGRAGAGDGSSRRRPGEDTSRPRRRGRRRRSDRPAGRRECDGGRRADVLQHERLAGLPDGDVHRLRGRARGGTSRSHREHVADDRVADDADQYLGDPSSTGCTGSPNNHELVRCAGRPRAPDGVHGEPAASPCWPPTRSANAGRSCCRSAPGGRRRSPLPMSPASSRRCCANPQGASARSTS